MERPVKLARLNKNMVIQSLNELPDELILKILSLVPPFNEIVATRLLSKWCEEPWKLVADVTVEDDNEKSLMRFLYGSLFSNDGPILETLRLKLIRNHSASDISFWVQTAVDSCVRKLRLDLFGGTLELPRCLSTCTTLKSLILRDVRINDVPPGFRLPPSLKSLHLFSVEFSSHECVASLLQNSPDLEYLVLNQTNYKAPRQLCLSSLKSLHLCSIKFPGHNSLTRLLQSCPVLESLVINRTKDDNVRLFNINVPTLKSLSIDNAKGTRVNTAKGTRVHDQHGFVIEAPGLEKLNFKDTSSNFLKFGYMPDVTTANIEVSYVRYEKFIGSLTFIQHLSLCSPSFRTPYPRGTLFFFLEHLELCTCSAIWGNLLASMLNDAPGLRSIKLKSKCSSARYKCPMELWIEPTVVPECLLKHLEILKWREYEGKEQERKVAAYILANATCLKMATFSTRCSEKYIELEKMSRVSEMCQLVFEEALM